MAATRKINIQRLSTS